LSDYSFGTLVFFALAAGAGGFVKGIAGFGMPLISVSLIASVTGPAQAIMLMMAPNLGSNILQAFQAGQTRAVLMRFWSLILPLVITTFIASQILVSIDPATASFVLGILVLAFTALQLSKFSVTISARGERFAGPFIGLISGFLGGVSSFFGPPLTMYLVALKLPKTEFIGTTATCFTVGFAALYLNLALNGLISRDVLIISVAAAVPTILGYGLGRKLSRRIGQQTFEYIILSVLGLVGLNLLRRGVL
jgi:uncharacterized membrane protein YfcA